jgi:Flp pilus assembly protein TadG
MTSAVLANEASWRSSERAQVLPLFLFCMIALLGISALVVDTGYWYREKRQLQAGVDAAALAGAEALPDKASAIDLATTYAGKNGLSNPEVTVSTSNWPNDTINVRASRTLEGIFSRVLDIASVRVGASATAATEPLTAAANVAPIAVSVKSLNSACGVICPGVSTTLTLISDTGSGDFGLVSLDGQSSDQTTLADWIQNGYPSEMALGTYDAVSGNKYSSAAVSAALSARLGTQLVLPVFSKYINSGTNTKYTIIGWIGFDLLGFTTGTGGTATLRGVAHRVVADGDTGVQDQPTWSGVSISLTQ